MSISFAAFLALYYVSILLCVVVATFIFVDMKKRRMKAVFETARRNARVIAIFVIIPLFVLTEKWFFPASRTVDYTPLISSFYGSIPGIVQHSLLNPAMTAFMEIIYVHGFTFIIYFTPYLLIVNSDDRYFKEYTGIIFLNYLVLIPFYIYFPVHPPAYYLTTVSPLLYNDHYMGRLVTGIDPLDNCFPSGHISLILSTLLFMWKAKKEERERYEKYAYFLLISFLLIALSILYLGIHWPADILAGIALAYAAYYVVERGYLFRLIDALISLMKKS